MKLLITGGCGFIGSAFLRMWHAEHPDDQLINLDALTYAANPKAVAELEGPNYTFIQGNITDTELVKKTIEGVDWVIHFAAETHVDRSISGPAVFIHTNVLGTQVLLDAARDAQVKRFHHISTDEVFGELPLESTEKFSEATPYYPHSPYSASKAAADHLVRAYHRTYGLPITISNCTNNYGPWQFPEKLIPVLIGKAVQDKKLPVYGEGKNVRDWIHVDDHNHGVALILEKGHIGETYCLGGNAERTSLQMAQAVLKQLGKPDSLIEFVEDRAGHDLRYAVDSSKIERELDWKRQYDFEQGLAATIEWYVKHPEMYP